MSKLPKAYQFIDLSDYGRRPAKFIAKLFKGTKITPIHITVAFFVSGLIAVYCILNKYFWPAGLFLILKSVLDAADGELARLKNKPSYTGRFFDSVADIILNLLIFLSIWYITNYSLIYSILAFIGVQLQGTLYNYYYTIVRNKYNGDKTSRIFENITPIAMQGENQKTVDILFLLYKIFYGIFDKVIYSLDYNASKSMKFPNWFMTILSIFGLGFQLLIISVMLVLGWDKYIIPFFIFYSVLIFVFIGIRKILLK